MREIHVANTREKAFIEDYFRILEKINDIKELYFNKWRENLHGLAGKPLLKKVYHRVINSDIATSGSYLDSIFTDILADKKCIENGRGKINNYLNMSHVFTLLIIARSLILNTAYINIYDELKADLDSLDYNPFQHAPSINHHAPKTETLLDTFKNVINIFEFKSGDDISILSQLSPQVKGILGRKAITIKGKKPSELNLVYNLQYNLNEIYPNMLEDEELTILYELTSKSFHRHEVLMFTMNNLINGRDTSNIDKILIATIFRIIKICTVLYGFQINIICGMLGYKTSIEDDIKQLIDLE